MALTEPHAEHRAFPGPRSSSLLPPAAVLSWQHWPGPLFACTVASGVPGTGNQKANNLKTPALASHPGADMPGRGEVNHQIETSVSKITKDVLGYVKGWDGVGKCA